MEKQDQKGMLKIPFFRLGAWKHPRYGTIHVTQDTLDQMKQNFANHSLGRPVFVRLGHEKDQAQTFGDTPAEAWVVNLVQEGAVLYAQAVATNEEIKEAVANKKFRFASAEYEPEYVNKETGQKCGAVLSAIALTNEPFLTRLPETVVLADRPNEFYLDYAEVQPVKEIQDGNELFKKLAEFFGNFLKLSEDPARQRPLVEGLTEEQKQQLTKVSQLESELTATRQQLSDQVLRARETEVDRKLTEMVAKGIPPAMCEKIRPVLLAEQTGAKVKLADGQEKSMGDMVLEALEALPQEHRVKLAQLGFQSSQKTGATAKDLYGDVVPELNKK